MTARNFDPFEDGQVLSAAQCRTALRFGVLNTALRASNLMNEPAFRHEIAKEAQL